MLSLENGTVVKQGVSPRGLCQGTFLCKDCDVDINFFLSMYLKKGRELCYLHCVYYVIESFEHSYFMIKLKFQLQWCVRHSLRFNHNNDL